MFRRKNWDLGTGARKQSGIEVTKFRLSHWKWKCPLRTRVRRPRYLRRLGDTNTIGVQHFALENILLRELASWAAPGVVLCLAS